MPCIVEKCIGRLLLWNGTGGLNTWWEYMEKYIYFSFEVTGYIGIKALKFELWTALPSHCMGRSMHDTFHLITECSATQSAFNCMLYMHTQLCIFKPREMYLSLLKESNQVQVLFTKQYCEILLWILLGTQYHCSYYAIWQTLTREPKQYYLHLNYNYNISLL